MNWPNNSDGDVLRRLESHGFDFTIRHKIDFQVDFVAWPPAADAIAILERDFLEIIVHEPDNEFAGYIELSVVDYLTYELVTKIQSDVTRSLVRYGGICNSWGVLSRDALN